MLLKKKTNYSVYSEPVMSAVNNSPTAAYASVMKSAAVDKRNTEWSGRNVGAAARFETLRASLLAVLTSSHPQAMSGSGPGGNGDPPDGGNDDESGDGEGEDWITSAPTAADLVVIKHCVGGLVSDLYRNPDYQREKAEDRREAQRLADDTLAKQAEMLTLAMMHAQEENARLAGVVIEAKKRLADTQHQREDNSEERKEDNKRFLPGSKAAIDLLRQVGEAGNMLGFGIPGEPMQIIGAELHGAALYRSITDYAYAPGTTNDLKCRLTPDMIWNLCGFKFGGAPDPGDPHGLVKYPDGSSGIMDWLKLPHRDLDKTQKSYSNAVPKKEKAGFKTDAERGRQQFKNIYQVKDACETLGKTLGRIYTDRVGTASASIVDNSLSLYMNLIQNCSRWKC